MKTFFVIIFLIISLSVKSQQGYAITFKRAELTTNIISKNKFKFVYNDSFAFQYYYQGNDPLKKQHLYSKKLIHHSIFINRTSFLTYNEVDANIKLLIVDTIKPSTWMPTTTTKNILGYTCKGALQVSPTNDSTLIWYTDALGTGVGFLCLHFNLGQPLEVYDQRTNRYFLATTIEKGNYQFNLPKAPIYSVAAYQQLTQQLLNKPSTLSIRFYD
ncbi:hypothetical protein ACFOWM_00310 [Ferruginibacter yonginensis]|uniref:GLPGLI family protein n=1 Tax=Ferruginibacter yonginensis TaxID=1310416 RepID=A0ABV8QQI8_9BACT